MFYSQTSDTGSFIRRTIEIVVWNNVESFKFYLFMIFLFFVCFIGIIILAYSWNKLSSFLFLIYFKLEEGWLVRVVTFFFILCP